MQDTPPGFQLMAPLDRIMEGFAPIYIRLQEDKTCSLGFRVGPQHCNPRGSCHGGTWATTADILMGINVGVVTGLSGPTVNLSIDYLGAAIAGQWVEGHARILRHTRNLGFADCVFTADGEVALRANGIFRRKSAPYRNHEAMLARAPEAST